MGWAFSCDRCGAPMGRKEQKIYTLVRKPISYDLCNCCFNALIKFIETKP